MQKRCAVYSLAFTTVFLLSVLCAQAQVIKVDSTTNWKKAFRAGLNLNQASFSSNWKAGGINSIGINAFLNYKANYKKDKHSWDNEIDLLYGMVNNQGQGQRKTLDRIYLDTKYGRALNTKWDMFLSANFLTQFAPGYAYGTDPVTNAETETLISDIMAPAFITTAWGVEYHPVDYFKVRIAPFAPRLTVVTDNNGRFDAVSTTAPYGVELGESVRTEWLAFQMLAQFDKDIAKNLNLKWRYMMFANYETLEAKTIDHRLDLNLVAKVNRFVNVSFGGIVLYDFDQDSGVQLSQALNLGVLYTFQNYQDKK